VFRVVVSVVNTSAWVVGCPAGFSGLLASIVTSWASMDECGWKVWGMCVVWMVASGLVRT
jgi:hypothetical protein